MKNYKVTSFAGGSYVKVYGFMVADLKLSGSELFTYAMIFSYTKDGKGGLYYGTQKYLAATLGISVRTLQKAIAKLKDKGLVENAVSEDGEYSGLRCSYVHEREGSEVGKARKKSGIFSEEQRERAYDNLVRQKYGELGEEDHLAAKAAVKYKIKTSCEEKELNEKVERILKELKKQKESDSDVKK